MKPPQTCRRCNEQGHSAQQCTNAYIVFPGGIEAADPDMAWASLLAADASSDLDDFKQASRFQTYNVLATRRLTDLRLS